MSTTRLPLPRRTVALILNGVVGIAAVGYLVGINYGVPREEYEPVVAQPPEIAAALSTETTAIVPAAKYSDMRRSETGPTSKFLPTLEPVSTAPDFQRCITCHDPHLALIKPSEEDKLRSLTTRAGRRAFNGAPPAIPHAVERTDDAACYACHGPGVRVGDRIANRMSHGVLTNCIQCHAAPSPRPFAHLVVDVGNAFVGLPAPTGGERAFPGAPPAIPHSTWMRERCLSCHGGIAGWPGLEVTHRWRTNCLQCHITSAELEQSIVAATTDFVPAFEMQQP